MRTRTPLHYLHHNTTHEFIGFLYLPQNVTCVDEVPVCVPASSEATELSPGCECVING